MKKLSTLFMVLVLVCGLSFIGCKKQDSTDPAVNPEGTPTTEAPATEAPATETK